MVISGPPKIIFFCVRSVNFNLCNFCVVFVSLTSYVLIKSQMEKAQYKVEMVVDDRDFDLPKSPVHVSPVSSHAQNSSIVILALFRLNIIPQSCRDIGVVAVSLTIVFLDSFRHICRYSSVELYWSFSGRQIGRMKLVKLTFSANLIRAMSLFLCWKISSMPTCTVLDLWISFSLPPDTGTSPSRTLEL